MGAPSRINMMVISVLYSKELYELVGGPEIQRLNELSVSGNSRFVVPDIRVFSLPPHAMGPIPSDGGPPRYFLRLYITSYALSTLIEFNNPGSYALA